MSFNKLLASVHMLLATIAITFSATITYQEDPANFPNPERGYYITSISANALQAARKEGMTLARKYYRRDAYWNMDVLPPSVLDGVNNDAAILRQEGAKLIPRFAYNFGGANNPPLERMLKHIEQLAPVLRTNSDIIAFIEAGFIGMCGEWHFSRSKDTNNNPRVCELVFRNTATNKEFIVKLTHDPRRWCMTDSAVAVDVSAFVPAATPAGQYAVYLNLPDPAGSIRNRPEYSIRLANKEVWKDATGYNSLLHKVRISSAQ